MGKGVAEAPGAPGIRVREGMGENGVGRRGAITCVLARGRKSVRRTHMRGGGGRMESLGSTCGVMGGAMRAASEAEPVGAIDEEDSGTLVAAGAVLMGGRFSSC